jgi:hypothetical protein
MNAEKFLNNRLAAAEFNALHPLKIFEQFKKEFGSKEGGNPEYRDIIQAAKQQTQTQTPTPTGACFVAGTLVHTKEGLVPIEQIKVGDYVLSKHESGEGEQSYQRVTKTFINENQPVMCLDICSYTIEEGELAEKKRELIDPSRHFPLVATKEHPFWVVNKGWVTAGNLWFDWILEFADGSLHELHDRSYVVRTNLPDIGWLIDGRRCPLRRTEDDSRIVDLSGGKIATDYNADLVPNDEIDWVDNYDKNHLLRTVYNLEVENTHTYYVGELGVWVHNKSAYEFRHDHKMRQI